MPSSNLLMYTTEDGLTKIEATFENDTVWLSLDQMAELFQRNKSTISRHIKKIFEERELDRNSVVANFATIMSTAIVIYFGEWIKSVIPINLIVLLLLVHVVYIGIRCYVKDWQEERGYY